MDANCTGDGLIEQASLGGDMSEALIEDCTAATDGPARLLAPGHRPSSLTSARKVSARARIHCVNRITSEKTGSGSSPVTLAFRF